MQRLRSSWRTERRQQLLVPHPLRTCCAPLSCALFDEMPAPHLFDRRVSVFTQAVAYVEKFSGGVGEVTRTQDAVVDIRQCVFQRCSLCGWRDHVT